MQKKIITGVLLLIIGGSLALVTLHNTFSQKHVLSSFTKATSAPIPTGSGKPKDPKTWSRYTFNQEFSISYPPQWKVELTKDASTVTFETPTFCQDDDFTKPYGNSNEVVYSVFGKYDTSDMSLKNGNQFTDEDNSETMVVTNLKHIKVADLQTVEFDYYPTDNTHFLRTRISILRKNTMYRFNATYADTSGKQLFEKMIQSISFM